MKAVSERKSWRDLLAGPYSQLHALAFVTFLILCTYIPAAIRLSKGPWNTEQDGHGPFILAAAAWIAYSSADALRKVELKPAPWLGWPLFLVGVFLMVVGRTQDLLAPEVFALLPLLAGAILLTGGWAALRILRFPVLLMVFVVPPPGWAMDVLTLPLKAMISDVVARLLYAVGYPIAQNGVVLMVGSYQLLVKDACSGMNSIFALSAIGFIYIWMMGHKSAIRNTLLLCSILPITIFANFLRVSALVLIAYYLGPEHVEGWVHDVTGFALFVVAFLTMLTGDHLAGLVVNMLQRKRPAAVSEAAPAE